MRLDAEDRRFRFFADLPDFLVALHAGAAVADGRFVAACECEGEIRGAGELLQNPENPEQAELAFSVEREWRRRGFGAALMLATIGEARRIGIRRLELKILPENVAMQTLSRHFTSDLRHENGNILAMICLDQVKTRAPESLHLISGSPDRKSRRARADEDS
jgi:GNAT superfamily N-acetyltransferase